MAVGNRRGVAVMLEHMDANLTVRRKELVVQVFRWNGIRPFGHDQIQPLHLFRVNLLKKRFKSAGGKLGKAIIPVEQFAFIEGAQLSHHPCFIHTLPPFMINSVYMRFFFLSILLRKINLEKENGLIFP